MFVRAITIGVAVLVVGALPVAAQQRGTLEVGAFGNAMTFPNSFPMNTGLGGGLRVGAFWDSRLALEFDANNLRGDHLVLNVPNQNVKLVSFASRVTVTPIVLNRLSFLAGGGVAHTNYQFSGSWGPTALVGARLALTDHVALRVDGVADFQHDVTHVAHTDKSLHFGLSFFRSPGTRTRIVTVMAPAPVAVPYVQREDSVSAEEQARLRRIAASYSELRDSLGRVPANAPMPAASASALATMQEMIYFASDRSDLSAESKATLQSKIQVFRANPKMRIIIIGNTDARASDWYNMALGDRRAAAAKDYLVSQGIEPIRIEITSNGKSQPIAQGNSKSAYAKNRRDEFRLLVASDYIVKPHD
jgi:peptidoglycan-associated lipoprotein